MSLPDAEVLITRLADMMAAEVPVAVKLVGLFSGGAWVAERLQTLLPNHPDIGFIDTAFYRDDYAQAGLKAGGRKSSLPFDVNGAHIVLIDDVVFTGRSVRAAINGLFDYGRPAIVELAALVDRGGRQLPIEPRWTAERLACPLDQDIVLIKADDGKLSLAIEPAERRMEVK